MYIKYRKHVQYASYNMSTFSNYILKNINSKDQAKVDNKNFKQEIRNKGNNI